MCFNRIHLNEESHLPQPNAAAVSNLLSGLCRAVPCLGSTSGILKVLGIGNSNEIAIIHIKTLDF